VLWDEKTWSETVLLEMNYTQHRQTAISLKPESTPIETLRP
jgi:hypothetical protein